MINFIFSSISHPVVSSFLWYESIFNGRFFLKTMKNPFLIEFHKKLKNNCIILNILYWKNQYLRLAKSNGLENIK